MKGRRKETMAFIHSRLSDAEPHECLRIAADSIAANGTTSDKVLVLAAAFFLYQLEGSKLQMALYMAIS
jgi:hypothetical protein